MWRKKYGNCMKRILSLSLFVLLSNNLNASENQLLHCLGTPETSDRAKGGLAVIGLITFVTLYSLNSNSQDVSPTPPKPKPKNPYTFCDAFDDDGSLKDVRAVQIRIQGCNHCKDEQWQYTNAYCGPEAAEKNVTKDLLMKFVNATCKSYKKICWSGDIALWMSCNPDFQFKNLRFVKCVVGYDNSTNTAPNEKRLKQQSDLSQLLKNKNELKRLSSTKNNTKNAHFSKSRIKQPRKK